MKTIHLILSGLVLIIGIVHIAFGTTAYDDLNFNALWFLGGGFYLIVLGLQNIGSNLRVIWSASDKVTQHTSNLLTLIFIGLGMYVMRDTQTVVISTILLLMTLSCFLLTKSKS